MRKSKLTENELIDLIKQYESSINKLKYQIGVIEDTIKDLKTDLKEARAVRKAAEKTAAKSAADGTKIRRRGRPRKVQEPELESPQAESPKTQKSAPEKKTRRRGRPRKVQEPKVESPQAESPKAPKPAPEKKTRRRGRPRKNTAARAKGKATSKASENGSSTRGYRLSAWDQFILKEVETANRVLTRSELDELVAKKARDLKKGMSEKQINAKISNVLHKLTNKRGLLTKDDNAEGKTGYTMA